MGQAISAIKETVQGDGEKQKQADDILNAINELGRTQAANFKLQVINDTVDINVLPIDRVIGYDKVINAM
ncbi:Hypothetical protein PENO1_034440 [Penicillium occitanis (nom. inval.)]|nr:Hypothetical protein PENO1_034440 [Penicillium occitanis (nom. inval.)]PCH10468.1 hypothetical protein PENOC_001360 [Penicillium occitanis (nom. inval.)]